MARKTFSGSHLEKRYNTYVAVLYVPKDVQSILGCTKFSRSTKTGDIALAEQRAAAYVTGWKALIAKARLQSPDPVIAEAQDLLRNLQTSSAPALALEVIDERTAEIAKESHPHYAEAFNAVAMGEQQALAALIPEWKYNEQKRGLAQKTIDQMERDVSILAATFPTARSITAQFAEAWITKHAEDHRLSASSVTRMIGFCRNFYRYLQQINEVPKGVMPFHVPSEYKKTKKQNAKALNKTQSWLAFTLEDVKLLYKQSSNDCQLSSLIKIAAYTGARIEELCSLKVSEVSLIRKCFDITDAKTHAGIRTVPIHSNIHSLVRSLCDSSIDGYLLSGLTFNKYGDRSNAVGKRFGRLKAGLDFGNRHVFHSIRKFTVTQLENAGVNENITADVVGHEKPRITYGLYSGGANLEVMREAIEKLTFEL